MQLLLHFRKMSYSVVSPAGLDNFRHVQGTALLGDEHKHRRYDAETPPLAAGSLQVGEERTARQLRYL